MHILVAVDGSAESQNALRNALEREETMDHAVTAVHVVDSEDPVDIGKELLQEVVDRAVADDHALDTDLLAGDPVEELVDYAEDNDVDVIYVGHRGSSNEDQSLPGDHRGPIGSVARGLIERTQIPVSVFDRRST